MKVRNIVEQSMKNNFLHTRKPREHAKIIHADVQSFLDRDAINKINK